MRHTTALFKKIALSLVCVILPLAGAYLVLARLGLIWTPYTCITETRQKILNLSGYDFAITETDCSTIVEDASVSVYVSVTGERGRALLFKYGPASDTILPSITVSDRGHISISIPVIADVYLQRHRWCKASIDYDIGRVIYPDVKSKAPE